MGGIDLYWLPLGSGGIVVRRCGQAYEALTATIQRRERRALYHAALVVELPEHRYAIEIAPVLRGDPEERGVVVTGPVGNRLAGRLRIFRYELRCWPEGEIPDLESAVESPLRLSDDEAEARRLLTVMPELPPLVWGLDEIGAGEMWTSNSVIAWLIARAGLPAEKIRLPAGGRAPGWDAGIALAMRDHDPPRDPRPAV